MFAIVVDISVVATGPVSTSSMFAIVVDISVVAVAVVVDVFGTLRVRGTVDIPRLMMVNVLLLSGVNVGASMPN
jgi:hypothetical protein